MSPADQKGMLKDGNAEFSGGQDNSRSPSIIARNQVTDPVNCTFRGGKVAPRSGLEKITLGFSGDSALETAFKTGRFQHLSFYDGNQVPSLISSIGGRIFKQDLTTNVIQEISIAGDFNSPMITIGYHVQAENYWIYQDSQSYPIIYDGGGSRRALPQKTEVPIGNVMAYSHGRIVVALPDRVTFRAGDLLYGPSGTAALGYKDAILKFTENNYLNEGGDFQARIFGAPSSYGKIMAMVDPAQYDTQLGQGDLQVHTPRCIFTLNLPYDQRTTWKNQTNAIQTVVPVYASVSQRATTLVNCDVWYRALDGIRSYAYARRDFNTWVNHPMSSELGDTLTYDTQSMLEYGSAVLFDNRLMQTISPVYTPHGVYHRGLVALDFDLISNMNVSESPAWEGIWTGLRILQIVKGIVNNVERCFIYALNVDDEIECWEVIPKKGFDEGDQRIQFSFNLPSYNFGDFNNFKNLAGGSLFVDNVQGQVDIAVLYRSDQNPCWQPWDAYSFCGNYKDCGPFDCGGPKTYRPEFRSKLPLQQPADDFDKINGRKYRTGYEFQPRIEITGNCQVKQFRAVAMDEPERFNRERTIK